MAERRVVGTVRDRRGRIQGLVNSSQDWSPVSATRAIGQILTGLHSYYTGSSRKRRPVLVVQGPRGAYLRSALDTEMENNLDNLPEVADETFGDVFIEVSHDALQRALSAMHAAGSLRHQETAIVADRLVDLSIGCHELADTMQEGAAATAQVRVPVIAWVRRLDDLLDPGTSASATVLATVTCYFIGDRAGGLSLVTDWTRTAPDAIVVDAPDAATARVVRAALLDWTRAGAGGRFVLSGSPEQLAGITDAQLSFVAAAGGTRCRLTGMTSNAEVAAGPPPTLEEGDWSLGVQAEVLERSIVLELGDQLGGTPRPYGSDEVTIGDQFSLTAFDADLRDGGILFTGSGRSITGPSISARFSVDVSLAPAANGRLTANVESIDVTVNEWYAQVADFFSGGAIKRLIVSTLTRAFQSDSAGLGTLLQNRTARSIASLGTTARVGLTLHQNGGLVQRNGATVWGELSTRARRLPIASLAAVVIDGGRVRLDATGSWAPGGEITSIGFTFGDGQSVQLAGTDRALVVVHDYAAGSYTARVIVTDDLGQTAEGTRAVRLS